MTDTPVFYVPQADDSEGVWNSTKRFMEDAGYVIRDRRIYSVTYSHNGKNYRDIVGEPNKLVNETVLVILDAGSVFLSCTANRGVLRGEPVIVGKNWDTHELEFRRSDDSH